MNAPTMLYRCPGPHKTDGISYDYTIVEAEDVEATLAQGWHRDWVAADTARTEAQIAANEAEQKAIEQQLTKPAKAKKA